VQESRNQFLIALAMIVGGVVAFFLFLFILGIDPDEQRLGVLEWMVGGALIGPGFGYLIRWRQVKDRQRVNRTSS
jgi:hypothetical protein